MNVKVVPIGPTDFGKVDMMRIAFSELEREAKVVDQQLSLPTATWSTPVKFEKRREISNNDASITVSTIDEKYKWVSEGTKKHDIPPRPKTDGTLFYFKGGYQSKTTPKSLVARTGSPGTTDARTPKQVTHPGIKAREFVDEVIDNRADHFAKNLAARIENELSRL